MFVGLADLSTIHTYRSISREKEVGLTVIEGLGETCWEGVYYRPRRRLWGQGGSACSEHTSPWRGPGPRALSPRTWTVHSPSSWTWVYPEGFPFISIVICCHCSPSSPFFSQWGKTSFASWNWRGVLMVAKNTARKLDLVGSRIAHDKGEHGPGRPVGYLLSNGAHVRSKWVGVFDLICLCLVLF